MRRWIETWLARLMKWIGKLISKTTWCDASLNERSVIFSDEMVGERERVITDEEPRVLWSGWREIRLWRWTAWLVVRKRNKFEVTKLRCACQRGLTILTLAERRWRPFESDSKWDSKEVSNKASFTLKSILQWYLWFCGRLLLRIYELIVITNMHRFLLCTIANIFYSFSS